MSKDKKEPFSKVSDLQHWLGMSENGIRLYEKEGIITPGRNKENGYRQLISLMVIKCSRAGFIPDMDFR